MAESEHQPWVRVDELIKASDAAELERFFEALPPRETARVFANLHPEAQLQVLRLLEPLDAAARLEEMQDAQSAPLVAELPPDEAAAIVSELPSHHRADLISELREGEAEAILDNLSPEDAAQARSLARHAPDSAGGLMIAEYVVAPLQASVEDVLDDFRDNAEHYARYDVQYIYVAHAGRLAGVLPLREILLARRQARVRDLMIGEPVRLRADAGLDEVQALFDTHPFYGVPVVALDNRLLGVVRRVDVGVAREARAEQQHLKSYGIVGGEELRTMPTLGRSRRRLSWLSINIVLNMIAASVIAFYQDTLSAVIALAVFLPIISDMSGCSGNQAVAVSMRELTLGVVRPPDVLRVWLKEISVGMMNGAVLGLLIGGAAWLWIGNAWLGGVVGAALALNTLLAVSIGGTVPLLLKRMNVDPALASGPILTTITDMCGFFLLLGMATSLLPLLQSP